MFLLITVHRACVWGYSIVQHDVFTLGIICFLCPRASWLTSLHPSWEIGNVIILLCMLNGSVYWEHTWTCFQTEIEVFCFLKLLSIFLINLHKSAIYDFWEAFYYKKNSFVLLLHTYLLTVLQKCDFTSLIVVVLDL